MKNCATVFISNGVQYEKWKIVHLLQLYWDFVFFFSSLFSFAHWMDDGGAIACKKYCKNSTELVVDRSNWSQTAICSNVELTQTKHLIQFTIRFKIWTDFSLPHFHSISFLLCKPSVFRGKHRPISHARKHISNSVPHGVVMDLEIWSVLNGWCWVEQFW